MPGSSMKKRRRPEEETPQSAKKKVVFQQQPGVAPSFSVTKVHTSQACPPIIGLTPGISLPDSFPFDVYDKDEEPTAKRRKSASQPQPSEMALHSSAHKTIDYSAREERWKSVDTVLNHFLAIIDPQSGEVEIVQAKKMVVRGTVRSKQAPAEAMEVKKGKQTHSEARMELGEAFGTKKSKKALQAVAENAMLAESSRGKLREDDRELVNTIKDASQHMATQEELQAAMDQGRSVPRGNYDAEEIQDVYVPSEIIGAEVLNAIPVLDWQEKVEKLEAVQVPARFVANRIVRLAGDESVQKLKLLRYLLWVIIMFSTARVGKERGTKSIARREQLREALAPAPEVVIENIRRKFSDNGVMRKAHIDLLITHCCVFACIIDDFELNTLDLREDLKIEQKQLNLYFQEIGARIKQSKAGDKVNHIAKLALPLVLPKMRRMLPRK
ncbi:RNA polymerase I associated factor, A49-like protein [Staphylotrichum tortipilum]|uniref:RNA polymerase I associated factor, A49-like protein n=1 Tax=Staphylotrichum tortipilum TaxID=2831512 RepID=A0AAN6RUX7_9PEZI|nr:RNA polymerase I associated factor, A49-like protein [Staphylotrichum longicolle]